MRRTLLVVFMIVLLPLRGWMGDAMATTMGLQQAAAAVATATTECPDHAGMQMPGAPAADVASGDAGMADSCCVACQMCHAIAITASPLLALPAFAANAPPLPQSAAFTSASSTADFKPPIF